MLLQLSKIKIHKIHFIDHQQYGIKKNNIKHNLKLWNSYIISADQIETFIKYTITVFFYDY